jgi:putative membrane protein
MIHIFATICILGLASSTAMAQTQHHAGVPPGNPAAMLPGSAQSAPGVPAPNQTNNSDRTFVRALAAGGAAEVEAGKLAGRSSGEAMVRQFGEHMVQDHSKASKQLTDLAAAARIPLPSGPDAEHRSVQQQLERVPGTEFDLGYIRAQMADHQQTAQLLEYEIGSGEDAGPKAFASETLPVVLEHFGVGAKDQRSADRSGGARSGCRGRDADDTAERCGTASFRGQ